MKKLIVSFVLLLFAVLEISAKTVKTSYRNALVFAYSQTNNVYEDDNLKLEIHDECLWATNKTSKTIFIDISQCFLFNNGSSYPITEWKKNEKENSKIGIASSIEEFITIAPAMGSKQKETRICWLTESIYGRYTTSESPSGDFSDYDKRLLTIISELVGISRAMDPDNEDYTGTVSRHLTEDESVSAIGASIAYAFNKRAEEWESITISTWVSDIIFTPYYVEVTELKNQKGFNVKESEPAIIHVKADSPFEFDEDKSPMVVLDWEGNFNKGTYDLSLIVELDSKNNLSFVKKVIHFDGSESDWGDMKYVDKISSTKQK